MPAAQIMLIENQVTEEFKKKKYGLFPMSFNGCEVIAVFNALELAGFGPDLDRLISLFKSLHLMLWWGLWGSNVFALGRVFEKLGIPVRRVKLHEFSDDGIYIVSFWNRWAPFHGIHTVVTRIKDGRPETFNIYKNAGKLSIGPGKYAGRRFITGYKLL